MKNSLNYVIRLVLVVGLLLPSVASAQGMVFLPLVTDGKNSVILPVSDTGQQSVEDTPPLTDTLGFSQVDLPPGKVFTLAPGQAKKELYDDAQIEFGANAVNSTVVISITSLSPEYLPVLSQGMTNVTKGPRHGYRFLPHMKFANKITVQLPYQDKLIPPGMTEQDIRTYYFDEATSTWQALELVEVDTRNKVITSLTDHFTDMINATVTVPDHPEVFSNTPTSLRDIATADPSAQINLVEPPQPNARGSAQVSYPIELPPGRQGMEPKLNLSYNSSVGNGWVGVGWQLSIPDVVVDTRWGAPRYADDVESESYLVDGVQVTPLAHRDALQLRSAHKSFQLRVEGDFRRVVRHGDHPTNYWWEVVNKDGMRFYFGGDPATGALHAASVLTDALGHIYEWKLREVRDTHGNGVRFEYAVVTDTGLAPDGVPGVQIYPKQIIYTTANGQGGMYTVTFVRDRELGLPRRADVIIDGRGGFKMVTADRLMQIVVAFNGDLVRRYDLSYQQGAFDKTLLRSITQFGEDGVQFHEHVFTYYDEVSGSGGYAGFAPAELWNAGSGDNVTASLFGLGQASALGGTLGDTTGVHLYMGYSFATPTKRYSAGGKVGGQDSDSEGVLALIDLNGDGLSDKVFRSGDQFYMRLNLSGPNGAPVFSDPPIELGTLPAIARESSRTTSFGVESFIGISLLANTAGTFTTGKAYFRDVNGDGLPDLVQNGQVFFNHLEGNVPTFTLNDSSMTPAPIAAGMVDASGILPDYGNLLEEQIDKFPLHDTLRRWVAPYSGTIQISGNAALIEDTSDARAGYTTADGVRLAIQHNGAELWSSEIDAEDYTAKTPAGADAIAVTAGDRIYFRVQSVFDGAYDQVAWDPRIEYLDVAAPATDANLLNPLVYQASEDFVLAGRRDMFVQVPMNGRVHLGGDLLKLANTTDDIELLVYKNDGVVFSQVLAWDESGAISPNLDIDVAAQDMIRLRVRVDSPVDVRQIQWVPELYYVDAPGAGKIVDEQGNPLFHLHPSYDVDLYPANDLIAPQQPYMVPATGTIGVQANVTVAWPDANGTATFTVKRPGELVAKQAIAIVDGVPQGVSITVDANAGDLLFFDVSVHDLDLADQIGSAEVFVTETPGSDPVLAPSALHKATRQGVFAQPYRGWGYAGYHGNREFATMPIDESRLVQEFVEGSEYSPGSATVYLFSPYPAEGQWRGPDINGYVEAGIASSSRLGPDAIGVPTPDQFAGARAVNRLSRTQQDAIQAGVGFLSGSLSGYTPLRGESVGEVDFLDMNGDRYPDIVANGRIQYTTPDGGLESAAMPVNGLGSVRQTDAKAANLGVGGSAAIFESGSDGRVDNAGHGRPAENNTGAQMVTLGLGLSESLGSGESAVDADLIDINGDGLPDRVKQENGQLKVALNLGYRFADYESWGQGEIHAGSSQSAAISANLGILGYNDGIYGFAGGSSFTINTSRTQRLLTDINGDTLIDQARWENGVLLIAINTGAGFAPEVAWQGALGSGLAQDSNVGLGGGFYFTIGIGPLCLAGCYVILNPGADLSRNMARPEVSLHDVDGDGYVDHVFSSDDSQMSVARNRTGRTNLLKTVTRPLGASFEIAYTRSGNTVDQPGSSWVMARVMVADGFASDGADTQLTTYRYENGVYDRQEREFYGYGKVVEEQRDPADGALYRAIHQEFYNDSFYTKGLVKRIAVYDADGNLFDESLYTYTLRDITTGVEPADGSSISASIFPQNTRIDQRFYEGGSVAGKSTFRSYTYDTLGNIETSFDAGDEGTLDDLTARYAYSNQSAACVANYIVGVPTEIEAYGGGALLRHRTATVDCATGNVSQVRESFASNDTAVTDLVYFSDGNLRQVIGPANHRGQRYQVSYTYDTVVATHITGISDSFGYASSATVNFKYGKPASMTDLNGNVTTTTYDRFGRLSSVTGPYEQGGPVPTIRFDYGHQAVVPWALTRHYDPLGDPTGNNTIDTVQFVDGLARVLQIKKDGTIHTGVASSPADVMLVSGRLTFDAFGRTVEQYHPVVEAMGAPTVMNTSYDTVAPTRFVLDVKDRNVVATMPDNKAALFSYGFGGDREGVTRHVETITDANGVSKTLYRDVRDLLVAMRESGDGSNTPIWTSYSYDALEQLVQIRDDQGNITTIGYDLMGRRTRVDSPDAGLVESVYDPASNVIAKVTGNLRAEGQQISYTYEFNRLATITYPSFPDNNVTFTYGAPGAEYNRAGRVMLSTDASGSEELFYGKLGEVVKQTKTIASTTQGASDDSPEVYTTQYAYDTWNRLHRLSYPDGEVVTYTYDAGGNVRKVSGVKGQYTYAYVNRLEYDKFEVRAFVESGNNVRTSYRYDPANRRLMELQAAKVGNSPFQKLLYAYDDVGNVLQVANNVPVLPANQMGGPSTQIYRYDGHYRLIGATGSYEYAPGKQNRYTLSLGYDSLHNLTTKQQVHEIVQSSGVAVGQSKTSYTFAYTYTGAQPHAPTTIGDRTFQYDANGNQTGWTHNQNGTQRTVVFDEENRVRSISDNGQEQEFVYNHTGERIIKRGPQGEAVYVNMYFSIRNREVGTKHIFVGETLYVSKLMYQDKPGSNPNGGAPLEKDLYFSHADHLGSATYVTDSNGQVYQHLEYFPTGETWVEEASDKRQIPYLFTGKELDEETGLYYFGARYYDPRIGLFMATDPAYSTTPEEAVNNPRLYNLYAYAMNNPLRYIDPDGRNPRTVVIPSAETIAFLRYGLQSSLNFRMSHMPKEARAMADMMIQATADAYKIDISGAKKIFYNPSLEGRNGKTYSKTMNVHIGLTAYLDDGQPSVEKLASIILHEMVHVDQYIREQNRKGGSKLGMQYMEEILEVEAYDVQLDHAKKIGMSAWHTNNAKENRKGYLDKLPDHLKRLVEQRKYEEAIQQLK